MGTMEMISPMQALKRRAKRRSKGFLSTEMLIVIVVAGILLSGAVAGGVYLISRANAQNLESSVQNVFNAMAGVTVREGSYSRSAAGNIEARLVAQGGFPEDRVDDSDVTIGTGLQISILAGGHASVNPLTATGGILANYATNDNKTAYFTIHDIQDADTCNQIALMRPNGGLLSTKAIIIDGRAVAVGPPAVPPAPGEALATAAVLPGGTGNLNVGVSVVVSATAAQTVPTYRLDDIEAAAAAVCDDNPVAITFVF